MLLFIDASSDNMLEKVAVYHLVFSFDNMNCLLHHRENVRLCLFEIFHCLADHAPSQAGCCTFSLSMCRNLI